MLISYRLPVNPWYATSPSLYNPSHRDDSLLECVLSTANQGKSTISSSFGALHHDLNLSTKEVLYLSNDSTVGNRTSFCLANLRLYIHSFTVISVQSRKGSLKYTLICRSISSSGMISTVPATAADIFSIAIVSFIKVTRSVVYSWGCLLSVYGNLILVHSGCTHACESSRWVNRGLCLGGICSIGWKRIYSKSDSGFVKGRTIKYETLLL